VYPNDDNPLRRIELADIREGEDLAHVAGRKEWVWLWISRVTGQVEARVGGTRERRAHRVR